MIEKNKLVVDLNLCQIMQDIYFSLKKDTKL